MASRETNNPVTENTVFEAGSLTKPVFAYAALKLVEDGQLELDTPLSEYLDKNYVEDGRVDQITARRVLSHTTGFPNWRPRGGELKIHFDPGEKFSYSGEGYVYLQTVVAKLTGKPVKQTIQDLVFEPLGMENSSVVWRIASNPMGRLGTKCPVKQPNQEGGKWSMQRLVCVPLQSTTPSLLSPS